VAPSPVAGLGLPYPAALSFPWPSLTALTLSEREREKVTESSTRQLSECVHVYNATIISEEEKQKG